MLCPQRTDDHAVAVPVPAGSEVTSRMAAAVLVARNSAGSLAAGLLGAVAAGLSGYVSHTFIRSQETAARHLREYFLQPLEFSRYLVAERLLNTLDNEKKAAGILAIVSGISAFPVVQTNALEDDGEGAADDEDAEGTGRDKVK